MSLVIHLFVLLITQSPPAASQPVATTPTARKLSDAQLKIIADFVQAVEANQDYDARGRAFVKEAYAQRSDSLNASFINECLAVLSPAFRAGLELMENDRVADAADVFATLSEGSEPYLAVAAANQAAAALVELEDIERCQTILEHVDETHDPVDRYTLSPDNYFFMLGYCRVHTLKYDEAEEILKAFLTRYPEAPQRLRITAQQILTELQRRSPGKLGDVRDLMALAGRRMRRGDAGEDVIKPQTEALAMLDKLIEEAKDQENSKSNSGGGSSSRSKKSGKQGQMPKGGAARSMLPEGQGTEGELRKTRAKPGAEWGKMPPKQREQILQSLQKEFPGRYRELLEQYYESLAKDASNS
jgi:tetratricopeptide (TPR) repeat protein